MNRKITTSVISIIWLALAVTVGAATYVVQVGEDIQTQVASAASGDVVLVRGGTFPNQTITISQPIRLAREKGTTVTIGGQVTLSGVTGDVVLRDFAINLNGNGKLVIQNCTKVGLEDLTELPQGIEISNSTVVARKCAMGNLTITNGSTVEVIDCALGDLSVTASDLLIVDSTCLSFTSSGSNLKVIDTTHTTGSFTGGTALLQGSTATGNLRPDGSSNGNVTITNCAWRAHGSTFKGYLTSSNSHSKLIRSTVEKGFLHLGTDKDCTVFQSTVGSVSQPTIDDSGSYLHALHSDANRTWVAYSTIHHAVQEGGAEAHFVGNQIHTDKARGNGIIVSGTNCVLTVTNNHFYSGNTNSNILYSQNNTSYTDSNVFSVKKTISSAYLGSWGKTVGWVTNQIYQASSSNSVHTECYMKFHYKDGSTANSNTNSQEQSWSGTKTYNNPVKWKLVTQIDVYLRNNSSHTSLNRAVLRNHKVFSGSDGITVSQSRKVAIHNNLFRDWDEYEHCISIGSPPTEGAEIKGNAFWRDSGSWRKHAVNAPSGGEATNNYFQDVSNAVTGGIAHYDNVEGGSPGFVDSAGGDYTLSANSPLRDKGPADPEYNDHDGSRNDVGHFGGHFFDANGTNGIKPVVIAGEQSVYRLNVGDTTPVVIKARAAVATPNQ
jgi:hypothetical protein